MTVKTLTDSIKSMGTGIILAELEKSAGRVEREMTVAGHSGECMEQLVHAPKQLLGSQHELRLRDMNLTDEHLKTGNIVPEIELTFHPVGRSALNDEVLARHTDRRVARQFGFRKDKSSPVSVLMNKTNKPAEILKRIK